jgi:hypothetical protein
MKSFKNKLWFWLFLLCLLTPAGILIPKLFHAGDAWGEWDTEQVKEKAGYEPQGMKKDAGLWEAPIPDYSIKKENKTVFSTSINYILSAIAGIGIIIVLTWLMLKFYKKNE